MHVCCCHVRLDLRSLNRSLNTALTYVSFCTHEPPLVSGCFGTSMWFLFCGVVDSDLDNIDVDEGMAVSIHCSKKSQYLPSEIINMRILHIVQSKDPEALQSRMLTLCGH